MNSRLEATASAFPWARIMAFGLGILRLSPKHFWSMTLPELAAAMDGAAGVDTPAAPLDRDALSQLMNRFPDRGG